MVIRGSISCSICLRVYFIKFSSLIVELNGANITDLDVMFLRPELSVLTSSYSGKWSDYYKDTSPLVAVRSFFYVY